MNLHIQTIHRWLHREVQKRHAILLPLRLFIGLGWLRSSVEKLIEPDWYAGVALNHFFYTGSLRAMLHFHFINP